MRKGAALFGCFVMLHSPDGGALWAESAVVALLQPVIKHQDHVSPGTHTVIRVAGEKLGVREDAPDIMELMRKCDKPQQ